VDYPIHIEVEVVNWGNGIARIETFVKDIGILISQPAEHFGDAEERGRAGRTSSRFVINIIGATVNHSKW
jgi:hypothetical protein